ncbi:MAG: copper resistance protein NlpE N-terminal domain-containing protein [Saprospiraceae bacterium]|nr:copper resistance protein NlpE N-terminal domain-containing protein [Saprospiraceae bacterium]
MNSIKTYSALTLLFVFVIMSCGPKNSGNDNNNQTPDKTDEHNSLNSLDWVGVYEGTVPCADCEGIQSMILLGKDNSYQLETKYLGKSDEVFVEDGNFKWNDAGSVITLFKNGISDNVIRFQVGENKLTQLDMSGEIIKGELADQYILKKNMSDILEKKWILQEINGQANSESAKELKSTHLTLKSIGNRAFGNAGCNNFNGGFTISDGDKITFSPMASTKMACENMKTEDKLFKALGEVTNFSFSNDTFILKDAKMSELAKFVPEKF